MRSSEHRGELWTAGSYWEGEEEGCSAWGAESGLDQLKAEPRSTKQRRLSFLGDPTESHSELSPLEPRGWGPPAASQSRRLEQMEWKSGRNMTGAQSNWVPSGSLCLQVGLTIAFPHAEVLLPSRAFAGPLVARRTGENGRRGWVSPEQSRGPGAGARGDQLWDPGDLGPWTALGSEPGGRPRLGVRLQRLGPSGCLDGPGH